MQHTENTHGKTKTHAVHYLYALMASNSALLSFAYSTGRMPTTDAFNRDSSFTSSIWAMGRTHTHRHTHTHSTGGEGELCHAMSTAQSAKCRRSDNNAIQ